MSENVQISQSTAGAPTPVNTPLNNAPLTSGLSRPTVPDITEADEDEPQDLLHSALSGMVQTKLSTLIGKSSGYIEGLPVEVKRSVEALKGLQVQQIELQNAYKRECLELEKKYLALQQPLFERRTAIVDGSAAPTAEEIAAGEKQSLKDDDEYTPLPVASALSPVAIPEFWLTALRNHPGLADIITDRDVGALKHLTDITLSYLPNETPGFKLEFKFGEGAQEYFANRVLEKTYMYEPQVGYGGDFVYQKAVGTVIEWKEEKDLTKEYEIKKQRNKNTNRTRLVRKAHPTESFFNFFSPPSMPEGEDIEDEEFEDTEARLEVDYQIGEDIKEKIIPRAVDYFTGKALEYEIDDEDDDEDDFEFESDSEEEDGEEDSDEDPIPQRRRTKPAAAGTDAAECKQQ